MLKSGFGAVGLIVIFGLLTGCGRQGPYDNYPNNGNSSYNPQPAPAPVNPQNPQAPINPGPQNQGPQQFGPSQPMPQNGMPYLPPPQDRYNPSSLPPLPYQEEPQQINEFRGLRCPPPCNQPLFHSPALYDPELDWMRRNRIEVRTYIETLRFFQGIQGPNGHLFQGYQAVFATREVLRWNPGFSCHRRPRHHYYPNNFNDHYRSCCRRWHGNHYGAFDEAFHNYFDFDIQINFQSVIQPAPRLPGCRY